MTAREAKGSTDMSQTHQKPRPNLTRTTLSVLFIGGMIVAGVRVLEPFLLAIVWAMTLVTATWPLMLRVQKLTGNRRGIAVTLMTLFLLVALIVPFWAAISAVVTHIDQITEMMQRILSLEVPPPPAWLSTIPLVGAPATDAWGKLTSTGVREMGPLLRPYAGEVTRWFAGAVGNLGSAFVQFLLTVVFSAIMYARGESAADAIIRFGRALGGDHGEKAVTLVGQAIRGVALGVVVTALLQSALGGIALAVTGVPFAGVLTAVMFVLCLAQIGPALVLIPAVVWSYYTGSTFWATVLLVMSLVVLTMDNVLRPILIKKGADLPLLLILLGVIGGLIGFGMLGIFIGPVVLAVAYTLLRAWVERCEAEASDAPAR